LVGLDPAQVEAVRITRAPLVVHAGAGSGKTRVVSHRVAYAVATGAVDPRRVLVVTFTDKAAGEMVGRLAALGLPGLAARTFHAAALAQLRHFWPQHHDGEPAPAVLDSKIPIVGRLARALPGGYRFTTAKDLADEIEWAKSRRLLPTTYASEAGARTPPIPVELFVRLWAAYEREKDRAGRLDFDDMLTRTVDLLESDTAAAETVRARYGWFSVDEYQDTNPLQQRLLDLWLGDRDDLCVVGDEDQAIYTFAGATSAFLTDFTSRFPGARRVTLDRNYRSSPEILALANRLLAAEGRRKRLVATQPSGPRPTIRRCFDGEAELAFLVATIRRLVGEGTPAAEIAILVRINAQVPPLEAALTRAGIAFRVRGQRFFERPEVREALRLLRRLPASARGLGVADALEARLRADLGFDPDGDRVGAEARERTAALALILEMAREAVADGGAADSRALLADFAARAAAEAEGSTDGVNLLTLHRAKGLEWDAVLLPALEEGILPIRQAADDDEALAEERRLLYVGLTRARRHLALSWAERRVGSGDRESRRRPSRFLRALEGGHVVARAALAGPRAAGLPGGRTLGVVVLPGPAVVPASAGRPADQPLMADLRAWRSAHARADDVPAYRVATDALLAAIVEERPGSIAALRRVKGIGPAKLDRYGEEILAILARH
ncbi:MAG TPA: ATP-dependent DNA helicase UvrD2, partial [Candidatus Nanopelagicales bacterium]|nr:ATP-dependent DNA helicase UvrD2 [Candidatus Nanopelagicales bacterium]